MKYLSVCSGIEAATVAWHGLGWTPAAFSEIEPFPSAVLAHHWPDVQNLGDLTNHGNWPTLRPDIIVGGTPCQAFSVAGLRKGLEDPRGNLTLVFLGLLARERPRWVVWENVPGVLSDKTGAFGAFLGGLGQLGYGFAYRVLDAQFFGVAQRRRRVFVVGYLGDWRRAAAVLFEPDCLSGNPPPSREAGKGPSYDIAPCIAASGLGFERTGDTRGQDCLIPEVAGSLQERDSKGADSDTKPGHLIPVALPTNDVIGCLNSSGGHAVPGNTVQDAGAHQLLPVATSGPGIHAVRRLTPTECERLQGFPDGHTLIPWRNRVRSECPDGPRYKALGNSMAVPVMRWIGERIQLIDSLKP